MNNVRVYLHPVFFIIRKKSIFFLNIKSFRITFIIITIEFLKSAPSFKAMRPQRLDRHLQAAVLKLYRTCLRLTGKLVYEHQSTWYDYTKMKFRMNQDIKDSKKIKQLLSDAAEEVEFVENMLKLKKSST